MKTLYKLPLLDPQSSEGFKAVQLKGESRTKWSVNSYTLRGGLQEGVQVVEINNGKLSFAVLPTRGMGIWKGQSGDVELGWNSPVKDPVNPAFINLQDRGGLGWLKGFNEWFVRCGLNSMGAPGMDTVLDYSGNEFEVPLTLHGNIANVPARAVSIEVTDEAIILRGEVDESMMFGPALRLNTEIRTEFGSGAMRITDTVTNLGNNPQEHQMLYHINYGAPLLEKDARLVAPFKQVAPRDPRSTEGITSFDTYAAPEIGFVEQAYLYELAGKDDAQNTITMLRNATGDQASLLRFSLKDFPCFTLWKNTAGEADGYVTGLEPATNYPNSRRFEREQGRVLSLAGGESRTTNITIEALDTKEAVTAVETEIQTLQKTAQGTVHPQPLSSFSG
ncbi:aldose 1-epimerase family protein [Coraliomargarita sp. SDUM461004]|uniref:Aldose 1-epimerase family protein n=1 Tax=Thalassobacterium sedimentorum TaxID=3041258 RepID=A0ABU1AK51_9BACT|nr:aldose 1-epimerase family protein [Coraliomargarita sp. SDUM461004]MDQ8194553.1 aldose 1-epimerase family protein [Coraliomargarita sp. SDUM461004]